MAQDPIPPLSEDSLAALPYFRALRDITQPVEIRIRPADRRRHGAARDLTLLNKFFHLKSIQWKKMQCNFLII